MNVCNISLLKKELGGKRFARREELVVTKVENILKNLNAEFFCEGIEKN